MGSQRPHKWFARAITAEAAPPSISQILIIEIEVWKLPPKTHHSPTGNHLSFFQEVKNVQTIGCSLWPHTRADYSLSKSRSGLGGSDRLCPRPGQELALDGLGVSGACRRIRRCARLAVGARDHYAM